jgi:tetratricopeptide (TPR) repeat protein
MMTRDHRRNVWVLLAVFLVLSAVASEIVAPGQAEYRRAANVEEPGGLENDENMRKLKGSSFQALVPALLGVREVLASILWVQADDYFHRGEYRPIIQLCREITAIDPHQLDVYATGAWHMAYNFMDKRLIADGVEFLEDGCKKNDSVYDLFFELGYMHYDKTKDYPKSVEAYRTSGTKGTTTGERQPPSYVRHQLAHAMEKMGDIDAAVEQWKTNIAKARELEQKGQKNVMVAGPNTSAALHNLYITERRRNERMAAVAELNRDRDEALQLWQRNVALEQEWLKQNPKHKAVTEDLKVAMNQVERLRSGKVADVQPTDVNLHVTVTRLGPRDIEVTGTCDVLDLSRVRVQLADKDYAARAARGFEFKLSNCTLEWDNTAVNKGKFRQKIALNRDPADMDRQPAEIYPLKADEYVLTVTYNTRLQAEFIQDRYGWNGEGLTARASELKTDPDRSGLVFGKRIPLRYVEKAITLKKDDLLGSERKVLYKD